jgi:hypothetical protein
MWCEPRSCSTRYGHDGETDQNAIARAPESTARSPSIEDAIAAIKAGRMVIVVDDEDRENEGDLTMAASKDHAGSDQLHGEVRRAVRSVYR